MSHGRKEPRCPLTRRPPAVREEGQRGTKILIDWLGKMTTVNIFGLGFLKASYIEHIYLWNHRMKFEVRGKARG